ncbi:VOC family protein [Umezawaea endophytica]|uniref:VOC family protein n=1 Tax=Umezawaea endophytica TaxID=1654476 RepID=A0A9X2VM30_9PSEU|nr:VOC family protein [Umezawaea endophytica]MCS7479021.1 VOC family protein [Umezawaea endophytica]
MTDPFNALHLPNTPTTPDPTFAATLRARLEQAVLGVEPTTMTTPPTQSTLTPYLAVTDARAAITFYVEALGAVQHGDPIIMEDGKIGHAELTFGNTTIMLAEEFPEIGHKAPTTSHPSYRLEVPDVDTAITRATAQGAKILRPVADTGHGRGGTILDPFGHRWILAETTPPKNPTPTHGELGYHTFQVPDAEAAKTFYGAVLGWHFTPGRVENGWQIEGAGHMAGLWGGQGPTGWKLMYAVQNLETTLETVRTHGGTTGNPENQPYGQSAECTDNQGIEFWLWQP